MKNKISYYSIIVFILFSFFSCDKDLEVREQYFPLIVMDNIDISSGGVTFKAQLVSKGKNEIKEYGFVYTNQKELYYRVKCGTGNPPKEIEYKTTKGLYNGVFYHVRAYLATASDSIFSDEKSFCSTNSDSGNEMEITDFEPKTGNMGNEVTIHGKNLASDLELKAYIGEFEANIVERTETSVKIIIPKIQKKCITKIILANRYDTIQSKSTFNVRYAWAQKKDFNFRSLSPMDCRFSFGLNGKGYAYFKGQLTIFTYDPQKDEWSDEGLSFPYPPGENPSALVVEDKVFVLLSDKLYTYTQEKGWTYLLDYTGTLGNYDRRSMSYDNGKLYVVVTNPRDLLEIREYDLNTKQMKYINRPAYPDVIQNTAFFADQNKLYLLSEVFYSGSFKAFFEYDSGSWVRNMNHPGIDFYQSIVGQVSYFKYNGLFYMGLGNSDEWSSHYSSFQFWTYNPQKNEWVRRDDCLREASAVTTFIIGHKAYIITSGNGHTNASWVFEFDMDQQ